MLKDDAKEQISLFDLPPAAPAPPEPPQVIAKEPAVPLAAKPAEPVLRQKKSAAPSREKASSSRSARKAAFVAKPAVSGLVPDGDVRLTANIRQDLHLKLKITAAHRRTTIGELIEELVEKYL